MSNKKIYGQLVALTKEIRLREPEDGYWAKSGFFSGGAKITLWYTEKASEICHDIASMAISKHQELHDCSAEALSKVIQETLQKKRLNISLFNISDISL